MTVDDISELQQPGVMFRFGEYEFITQGINSGGLDVIRLESGHNDSLAVDLVEEHIEAGELEFLGTHGETEVAVPEQELIKTMKFFADDPALDTLSLSQDPVADSMLVIEESLPEDAYWFRYRND